MTRIEFGLAIDFGSDTEPLAARVERLVPLLSTAERLGFRSVWAGESHPTGPGSPHLSSPLLLLAALALETELELGTGILILTAWDPLRLAYDAAVLDQLSGGRLILGAAPGNPFTWDRFRVPRERLGDRIDQILQALRALWSGADGYAGDLIQVASAVRPLPVRDGGPPIWLGGLVPRAARRAARLADGWYAATNYGLSGAIAPQAARYLAAAGEGASDPRVAVNRAVVAAATDEEAMRIAASYVEPLLQYYGRFGALKVGDDASLRRDHGSLLSRLADELLLVGSPATINARLEGYAAAGVTNIQARVRPMDMPYELVEQTLNVLGEEVLPRWR